MEFDLPLNIYLYLFFTFFNWSRNEEIITVAAVKKT